MARKFIGGDRTLSRQQRWQIRKLKEGKCAVCGSNAFNKTHCFFHAVVQRERIRKRNKCGRRNFNCKSYHLKNDLTNKGK